MIASAQAYVFLALAVTLLLLGILALLALGMIRMESTLGIFRDGLRRGTRAPVWRLPDANGRNHATPSERKWQLLIFGDHSLREFRELVSAVKKLSASERELEILVLSRTDLALTDRTLNRLGLDVPIVHVDDRFTTVTTFA